MLVSICLEGQETTVFSLPESTLLFGNYNELRVVSPSSQREIHPPVDVNYNRGYFAMPSLAKNGEMVAWAFATEATVNKMGNRIRFGLGLYSLAAGKWNVHGDFSAIGDVALSPTGAKIAFVAKRNGVSRLQMFDVTKQAFLEGPHPTGMGERSSLSWSPDETRLVAEMWRAGESLGVGILDLNSSAVRLLGNGYGPRWSPRGDWIAYYPSGRECALVHPDGSGKKVVANLERPRSFSWGGPVWSPDGTQLLANVSRNGGSLIDVVSVDLATGSITTRSHRGLPVLGWSLLRP